MKENSTSKMYLSKLIQFFFVKKDVNKRKATLAFNTKPTTPTTPTTPTRTIYPNLRELHARDFYNKTRLGFPHYFFRFDNPAFSERVL